MTSLPPPPAPVPVPVSPAAAPTGEAQGLLDGVPRWVLGLVVGVPVAAALAYILFGGEGEGAQGKKQKKKKKPGDSSQPTTPVKTSSPAKTSPSSSAEVKPVAVTPSSPAPKAEKEDLRTPLEKAQAAKERGNKYFKAGRYELAISSYSDAISLCPPSQPLDLATFYQNRAAAHDQLADLASVVGDCDTAINLNNKYVKALDRRAKTTRKQAKQIEDFEKQVELLKGCLEDITSVCILEGFQKQEHLLMVDSVLKELGRAEAARESNNRQPLLTSPHFIQQYFSSFSADPILRALEKEEEGDVDEKEASDQDSSRGYLKARQCLASGSYSSVVAHCDEEIAAGGPSHAEARLLRATMLILSKQQKSAMQDLTVLIDSLDADVKVKVNALIKRASLYIQQCKDPSKDPQLAFADFAVAESLDPENADIYHHRGQVHLLIDELSKAILDFNKAVALQPNFPVAYVQKLFTDYRAASVIGDHTSVNNVLQQFQEATHKFPKCVETYALYAQVMNDQQEFEKADSLYKKGIEVDPKNANLLVHRGLVALQGKGDVPTAVSLIEQALQLDEKCEFAYETLGTLEVQRGNLKKAIELFNKAIPLSNTELEMAHLFGLRDAAMAQITVSNKLGVTLPAMGMAP